MNCLSHPYFEEKYENVRREIGSGSFGMVFEADFKLFDTSDHMLPVALKINFNFMSPIKTDFRNYLNLMVASKDIKETHKNGLTRYDLSSHFKKMQSGGGYKNDVPFLDMVYEAVSVEVPNSKKSNGAANVSVMATQLGFTDFEELSLPAPSGSKKDQMKEKYAKNLGHAIVQLSYGLWRIHSNGFLHRDLGDFNVILGGSPNDFFPLIIDFDFMQRLSDLNEPMTQVTSDTFNESGASEYSKYITSQHFISAFKSEVFAPLKQIPTSKLSPQMQTEMQGHDVVYLLSTEVLKETFSFIKMLLSIFQKAAEKDLVDLNNHWIVSIVEELHLLKQDWEEGSFFVGSEELWNQLNEASGFDLSSFKLMNPELDEFLKNARILKEVDSKKDVEGKQDKIKENHGVILV
jgi:serine/threonine protein kinase